MSSYIGQPPTFGNFSKQTLTANGVTTVFTLNENITNAQSIFVVNGGVPQEPGIAYTHTAANQITFGVAPVDGSILYVIFLGKEFLLPQVADDAVGVLQLKHPIEEEKGSDIASAATTDIGAATGNFLFITGVTTIISLGTITAGARRVVKFTGVLILTHNATSLQLPGNANITTVANDRVEFYSLGSGNWICTNYTRGAAAP